MVRIPKRTVKTFLFVIGWISFVLGGVGVFLPLIPTAPFMILSAWCFLKSSPKAHRWLYNHPRLGPALKDWDERGAISRRSKVLGVSAIVFSALLIWWVIDLVFLRLFVSIFLLSVSIYILTRPD